MHPEEADVARILLTEKAEARLGIRTVQVKQQSMPRFRTVGGIVAIPPGRSVTLAAPWTGTVTPRDNGDLPQPGSRVHKGDVLMTLVPLLSPDRYVPTPAERVQMAQAEIALISLQLTADGDAKQAHEEVEAAQIALNRAQKLFAERAGSARDVDDAQARLALAEKSLETAEARRDRLAHATLGQEDGIVDPTTIAAPVNGVLLNVAVAPNQMVTSSTALVEIADTSTVWIRVPIYVGQLMEVRSDAEVAVCRLKGGPDAKTRSAHPVVAPPSADSISSTVDLIYEMTNDDSPLSPGERVGVTVPLAGEEESLVIPWAAVLHDIHGGTWVYKKLEPQTYQRHRIEVRNVAGEMAVLLHGPDKDTEIVVDGAAELFGTEFGAGK